MDDVDCDIMLNVYIHSVSDSFKVNHHNSLGFERKNWFLT